MFKIYTFSYLAQLFIYCKYKIIYLQQEKRSKTNFNRRTLQSYSTFLYKRCQEMSGLALLVLPQIT